jgi:hypothetical protein
VCGNHIVWGATNVKRVRIRHVGIADTRAWHVLGNQLHDYMDDSASQEEARIRSAQRYSLGATEDDVIERVFKLGSLSKRTVKEAYVLAAANESTDGSPRTVWGLLQGLTRLSQRETFADRRVAIDRAAGKLMEISK